MPIVNGEEVMEVTANQFDELLFNINFGSVIYRALQPTTTALFSSQSVAVSSTSSNSPSVQTGNNAKMIVSYTQTGTSTNCTMNLYGSDHSDLSRSSIIATLTLGTGGSARFAIDPIAIPQYSYCVLVNNDSSHTAIATVEITTWQEPA